VFCYRGYNAPANFYITLLRSRGQMVEARDRVGGLAPGMHVVVSQDVLRADLDDTYSLELSGERFGCSVYTLRGLRDDDGGEHLQVVRATYGANCGAQAGNATTAVQRECDGRSRCPFEVNFVELGDPAPGCTKEFDVDWRCDDDAETRTVKLRAEAGFGSVARLECKPPRGSS